MKKQLDLEIRTSIYKSTSTPIFSVVVLVACVGGGLGLWKGGPVLMFHVEEGNKQTLNYVCGQHWSLKLRDMWTNVFFLI